MPLNMITNMSRIIRAASSTKNYFSSTKIPDIASKILGELSMNLDESSKWAITTLDESWNYKNFPQKPILIWK
ncbi:hypothetical protein PVOR_19099 [Paenibacillus vortex V453]|uniref:Uncharacterized protein n=2 Tax=Paenibacillus TaxID=44249 RepID=A0A163M6L0_9BACL|nr:hypothetical protein PVOR_19099 [Paenibacillus vortex V453]KZS48787.1 hypothetical protein AWU65_24045 [Paenibacillus glucanolyticus]